MIPSDLAKHLKDAGFSQVFRARTVYFEVDEPRIEKVWNPHDSLDTTNLIIAPVLSELIEACGEIELRLVRHYSENEVVWQADNGGFVGQNNKVNGVAETGSTPEEAVARLWLALNKK